MSIVKGKVEASISLNKSTCYFLLTGKCSLDIVTDYYITSSTRTAANDLLYCPRLYRAMCRHEQLKPIALTPCECGHAEVISGHQRACIASQKKMMLAITPAEPKSKTGCPVCSDQVTFDESFGTNRIVNLMICINDDEMK